MLFACLAVGMLFGIGAAALTILNGGGLLLALLAYSSGGALAILAIVALFWIPKRKDAAEELSDPLSA